MSVQFDIRVITGNSGSAIDGITTGLHNATKESNGLTSSLTKIGQAAFTLNNIQSAISGIANDFETAIQPGISFNDNLKDLQAITGVTESQLDKIGTSARQNAKDFGIDASNALNSYKLILSQLGPEIANNSEALAGMGKNASILSKQMGNDVGAATEVLTTAMNQYGVSLKDPIEATKTMKVMMDIMAAGAREGSAELPQVKSAIEQSGMMAKTANVSFNELNASIQVLDKAGKKGAEGGVAIRNVLAELGQGKMMPRQNVEMLAAAGVNLESLGDKTKSFSQRLAILKPIVNDTAAMTALFGRENVAAGIALINSTSEIDRLTTKITGTNTATEMAAIKMESWQEKLDRTKAKIKDFGISIFNATDAFSPFITMGMGGLQVMANLGLAANAFSIIGKTKFITTIVSAVAGMGTWIATTAAATAEQWAWNIAMSANPIGLLVIGIAAAVAAIVGLIVYWDDIVNAIKSFGAWIAEHNPLQFMIDAVDVIFPGFKRDMESLSNWVKNIFGGDATKDATKGAVDDIKKQLTEIPGITVKGAVDNKSTLSGYNPHEKKNAGGRSGKEMASNISSGGSRPTTINLVIQKLTGIETLHTTNLQGTTKEAGNRIVEEILMALNSVNSKAQTSGL